MGMMPENMEAISVLSVGQLAWKDPSPETVDNMGMMPENMEPISVLSAGQLAWKDPSPETVANMGIMPENTRIIYATLSQLFREFLRL